MASEHSEHMGDLAAALCKVQGALRPAAMNANNPFFKKRYADLNSIWDSCRDLLHKHGLSVVQTMADAASGYIAVDTLLVHTTGQWVSGRLTLPLTKADPQAAGSAITYARRYSLAAIVGIVSDEDDDAESTMPRKPAHHETPKGGGTPPPGPANTHPPGRLSIPPPCPTCGGEMWDNRKDRAEDEAAIKAGTRTKAARAAWKCKDKDCAKAHKASTIWPSDPNASDGKPSKSEAEPPKSDGHKADPRTDPARHALVRSMKLVGMPENQWAANSVKFLQNVYGFETLAELGDGQLKEVETTAYTEDRGVPVQGIDWIECKYEEYPV